MNALFLIGETLSDYGGISKKILAQKDALKRLGFKITLSYFKANHENKFVGRYVDEQMIDKYSPINIISKLESRIKYQNLYQYIKVNEIKLVYIRYIHFANPFFISFLKKLKKNDIKILLEIPTYPYDQEYANLKFSSKIVMAIEKFSRRSFKNYITRIITLTPYENIFGVSAIEIANGIDAASINMIKKAEATDEVHLIGVASISNWHGFDRVIEGLHYYYNDCTGRKKVYFHIVGDSSNIESTQYKELVKKHDLDNYVIFYGRKSGKELDTIFNKADIGVGSLACHRISIKNVKSLKNREYCARGLPFFYSETDIDFENRGFIFKVPANDNPIDIAQIVNFVENNKFDPVKIRNFAIENLSWDKQFEKIINIVFRNLRYSSVDSNTAKR